MLTQIVKCPNSKKFNIIIKDTIIGNVFFNVARLTIVTNINHASKLNKQDAIYWSNFLEKNLK